MNRGLLQEKVDKLISSGIISVTEFPSGIDCRIKNTNIYFSININGFISNFWVDRIGSDGDLNGRSYKNFEELLDSLDEATQTELLFHLDIFGNL